MKEILYYRMLTTDDLRRASIQQDVCGGNCDTIENLALELIRFTYTEESVLGGDLLSPVLAPGVQVPCCFSQCGYFEKAVLGWNVKRKSWTPWLLCPDSVHGRARAILLDPPGISGL